jgi:hypothetical protein
VDAHEGIFFDPDTVPSMAHRRPAPAYNRRVHDFGEAVDEGRLDFLRLRLKQSVSGLKRSKVDDASEKGRLFEALVAGEPLAEHGSRNATTTRVVFQLVRKFGDLTLSEGLALVEPSLEAMRREGSRLTRETVARMFETAFAKVEAQREADAKIEALLLERLGMKAHSVRR